MSLDIYSVFSIPCEKFISVAENTIDDFPKVEAELHVLYDYLFDGLGSLGREITKLCTKDTIDGTLEECRSAINCSAGLVTCASHISNLLNVITSYLMDERYEDEDVKKDNMYDIIEEVKYTRDSLDEIFAAGCQNPDEEEI